MRTYLSITPPESPLRPRLGAKESSSSKKIMQGAAALALVNTEEEQADGFVLQTHAKTTTMLSTRSNSDGKPPNSPLPR